MESPTSSQDKVNCVGCRKAIDEGSIIAVGESLFHLECFICKKCGVSIDCNGKLLLLDDGNPVCEDCSYVCAVCKKSISDEAIMTGQTAYHTQCFQCISCKKNIDDLVYTQTSKGIYCIPCHEKRKAEKQKKTEKTSRPNPQILSPSTSTPYKQTFGSESKESHAHRHTSRLLNAQSVADYMMEQKETLNGTQNSLQVRSPNDRLEVQPPTPTRSQSSSVDSLSKTRPNALRPPALARPKPSHSDIVMSRNHPSNQPKPIINTMQRPKDTNPDLKKPDFLPEIPSLNLTFFDNDNEELADLAKNLGVHLSIQPKSPDKYLSSSQKTKKPSTIMSSLKSSSGLRAATTGRGFSPKETLERLSGMNRKDFEKQEMSPEIDLRDQWTLEQANTAKANIFSVAAKQEIDRLAQMRIELEHTCKELKGLRDSLSKEIDQISTKKQAGIASAEKQPFESKELKSALSVEIKSLTLERDELKTDTQDLSKMRDEIIHEMVLLNTKNAELTKMNNDLSRRAIDREHHTRHSPSPTTSTELMSPTAIQRDSSDTMSVSNQRVASRNSFNGKHEPKLLKIKKKGSTLFGKLGGKSGKSDNSLYSSDYAQSSKSILYGMSNSSASTQSLAIDSSSRSIRHNPKPSIDSSFSYVSGPHSFQLTSFLRPVKCNACNDKMWGLHEYRCHYCGYQSHSKCLGNVPQLCSASNLSLDLSSSSDIEVAKSSCLFGYNLAAHVASENRSVPLLVERCIEAIELRGMDYEGIYRKSGGAAQMRAIQVAFEQGDTIDLTDAEEFNDVAAITSVLKQYFRELPDPLLTYDIYQDFIDAIAMQTDQAKTDKFISLMKQLPKANYDTLKLLMQHLYHVKQRSSENLMTTKNLAMVFAPTLMRDRDASRDFSDMSYKNATMDFVIDRAFELFV
ncbi:hypothetical protein CLU79DRAFT_99811 [Phycomyces nitens]|nr:hypothetical protein CLU79DRAFT_99811 [Phycomyces nitens]